MTAGPYTRTKVRDGEELNLRTLVMLNVAERRANVRSVVVQGSWSLNESSGGTHAGGGALDLRTWNLTTVQRERLLVELRRVGFAAWYRHPPAFDPHIHAIAIGDQEMSSQAKQQVTWYKQGLNGLWPPAQGPDDGPDVAWTQYPQELRMSDLGPEHWDAADWNRFDDKAGWLKTITDGHGDPRDAKKILEFIHKNGFETEEAAKKAAGNTDTLEQQVAELGAKLDAVMVKLGVDQG